MGNGPACSGLKQLTFIEKFDVIVK